MLTEEKKGQVELCDASLGLGSELSHCHFCPHSTGQRNIQLRGRDPLSTHRGGGGRRIEYFEQ